MNPSAYIRLRRTKTLVEGSAGLNPELELFALLDLCASFLRRRDHASILCIVPIATDDARRESRTESPELSDFGTSFNFGEPHTIVEARPHGPLVNGFLRWHQCGASRGELMIL